MKMRQKCDYLQVELKGLTSDVFFNRDGYNGNLLYDVTAINNMPVAIPREVLMATWTPTKGLNLTGKHMFPNTYSDFENVLVKIGSRSVSETSIVRFGGQFADDSLSL